MNKRDIVLLVSSETSLGVLESQVFSMAKIISLKKKKKVKIVLVGRKINFDQSKYSDTICFCYINKDFKINNIKNSLVYIRTIDIFIKNYFRLKLNNNLIIYDFRALIFAESFFRNRNYFKLIILFILEMIVYLMADRVCAVSEVLKKKLSYYFVFNKNVFVFPCVVSNIKLIDKTRNDDAINFVYLGGLSEWQMFDETIGIYKKIADNIKCSVTFTVITRDKDLALSKLKVNRVEATVKSLTNNEVLDDLKNYDFGFLIRENNLVNNVASPIKYLEYLSNGVIPIISEGIGDYSKEASKYNIGIVLKTNDLILNKNFLGIKKDKLIQERIKTYLEKYNLDKRIEHHPLLKL